METGDILLTLLQELKAENKLEHEQIREEIKNKNILFTPKMLVGMSTFVTVLTSAIVTVIEVIKK